MLRSSWLPFALAVALAGCTAPNPNWEGPGTVGSGGGGSGGGNGGGAPPDLGAPKGSPPDLASPQLPDLAPPPPSCTPGERRCSSGAPPASQLCAADGQWSTRVCPVASDPALAMCMGDFCQPPGDAQNCLIGNGASEDACYSLSPTLSCQPFIDPQSNGWMWFCAKAVGTGGAGDACTHGSQCRTGFCGSNGTCFRGCEGPGDCPQHSPQLQCKQVTIEVEGVQIFENGCAP
jgi:hypothetical protein